MINHRHRFIFIHIPKTGGTSMEDVLGAWFSMKRERYARWLPGVKHWAQHLTMSEILHREFTNKNKARRPERYFKFAFVRNPWDRLVSELMWRSSFTSNLQGEGCTIKNFLSQPFWSPTYCTRAKKDIRRHLIPQRDFIYDSDDNLLVDFVGRFENLKEDFDAITNELGQPQSCLPHRFKTRHRPYWEYYDDETRQIIAENYAKDIEYFDYKFGE